jgi:PIN domain nuclease of toxin-antitoxin system
MADYLADTHAVVWHLTDPRRLGRAAGRAFAAADAGRALCHVPAIAFVEIALLHERGRLRIGAARVIETLATHPGYAVLPMDVEQCLEFASLVGLRDPMDRLVAAAARATGARLISADTVFDSVLDGRVWG